MGRRRILLGVVEWKLKTCAVPKLRHWFELARQHELSDLKTERGRPYVRRFGVRKHRLEPDAEAADFVDLSGLRTLSDVRNTPDVAFAERLAIVLEDQAIGAQFKPRAGRSL